MAIERSSALIHPSQCDCRIRQLGTTEDKMTLHHHPLTERRASRRWRMITTSLEIHQAVEDFGSVMRFMWQRLQGRTNSMAAGLHVVGHRASGDITTRRGRFLRTKSIMPAVEPV
jgi:hypothetical protein